MRLKEKIRVVLAEDEVVLRSSLAERIEALDSDFLVVEQAGDGQQALEAIHQQNPHLLITDIKMPGMNGLELIDQVRRRYPAMKIVILSGYSDFSYMQQAIRVGVSNYLLKPVEDETLKEILETIKEEILASQYHHTRSVIYSSNYALEQINSRTQHLFLLCIGNLCSNVSDYYLQEQLRKRQEKLEWHSLLRQILPPDTLWYLEDEEDSNQKMLGCQVMPQNTMDCEKIAKVLQKALEDQLPGIPVTICTAQQAIKREDVWLCAQRIRQIMRQKLVPMEGKCFSLERDEGLLDEDRMGIIQMRVNDQLREAIETKNIPAAREELSAIIRFLLEHDIPQQTVQKMLLYILRMMEYTRHEDLQHVQTAILRSLTMTAQREKLETELLESMTGFAEEEKEEHTSDLTEQLVKYVNEHYLQLENLEDITEMFHYNYAYLSRVFKKATGIPMSRYVQEKRIELAKQLIENNDGMKLTEVGQMAGFGDKRHFQRVFKLCTGMTPRDYKKSIIIKG